MLYLQLHHGELADPITAMENYFHKGGASIITAAFAHSYFVHPDTVRAKTPYFPERARYSRERYPGLGKGDKTIWPGDRREVWLDDNQYAQIAWQRYTERGLLRGSGYGVRHIWGNPWNPDCFTAGWNLCYMPFWAGMLTERQHPHPELEMAIRQASWDLYFRNNPVCQHPDFVENPGLDLSSLLAGQPILILGKSGSGLTKQTNVAEPNPSSTAENVVERVKSIRSQTHQSWSNIRKAARALQGLEHEPFGTVNVENSSKSCVRKIQNETGLSFAQIETLIDEQGR